MDQGTNIQPIYAFIGKRLGTFQGPMEDIATNRKSPSSKGQWKSTRYLLITLDCNWDRTSKGILLPITNL